MAQYNQGLLESPGCNGRYGLYLFEAAGRAR